MASPIRTLVAGVAALEGDTVLPSAVRLAQRMSASLHVVHGYEVPHPILAAYVRLGMREAAVHELYGNKVRLRLQSEVRRLDRDLDATIHAIPGEGGQTLSDVLHDVGPDLVLLGATRRGVLMNQLLGSTADRVIRSAPAPVLILRPPFHVAFQRVLLTTDLSPASGAVVDRALEVVEQISAGEPPELSCLVSAVPSSGGSRDGVDAALRSLGNFASDRNIAGGPLEYRVRFGDPAHEVLAEAREMKADLVVVGTRGRTGVSRYFLGSVASSVLAGSTTSVLVIPLAFVAGAGREVHTGAAIQGTLG
jgi:universal stress protein E